MIELFYCCNEGVLEVSASIVGCLYAVGCFFVLERLNVFEFYRDSVLFVVEFAEEEDDRLVGSNDGFCFGIIHVVVNGQNIGVRLNGGV